MLARSVDVRAKSRVDETVVELWGITELAELVHFHKTDLGFLALSLLGAED
jgi:hypothetical protein